MNPYQENDILEANQYEISSEVDMPEPLDTWGLEDFDDVLN